MASGKLIDIPIITRHLARFLLMEEAIIDFPTMLNLDAGNHPSHPTGTVPEYKWDWWTRDKSPSDDQLLGGLHSLSECLSFHRTVNTSKFKPAAATTSNCPMAPMPHVNLPCTRCQHYRGMAMDALEEIKKLRVQVQHQEVTSENRRRLSMRRASGCNQLYEAVLFKETQVPVPPPQMPSFHAAPGLSGPSAQASQPTAAHAPTEGSKPSAPTRQLPARRAAVAARRQLAKPSSLQELVEKVREHSKAEYHRWIQHPSLKWTWGVDLERDDIGELFRAGDINYRLPHSGYDYSLKDGRLKGQYSEAPTVETEGWQNSSFTKRKMPFLPIEDFPTHFSQFPLRRPRTHILEGDLPLGADISSANIDPGNEHNSADGSRTGSANGSSAKGGTDGPTGSTNGSKDIADRLDATGSADARRSDGGTPSPTRGDPFRLTMLFWLILLCR
jgi:hypothetical protein